MHDFKLAVNEKWSQYGSAECNVRFLGQSEVSAFLSERPDYSLLVRAWVSEMRHRDWDCASALKADFGLVDISALPAVVFYLQPTALRIDTLIDFRRRTVLLTALAAPTPYRTIK
ncbi:MAG: hypothetical protein CL533_18370 [Afipia sp.]|jgi:mRNA-degrading endonuclease HigB of HigAB toxin-antitoxin module|nr:hypothetical protein [Afipia sp.]OUX59709.1 MAG: hypothetical protein CBB64_18325 [Afipia sp. TMED4]HCX16612.1 hypothetical protein [Afipia sp.]|tara:strand:+ start:98 stop:442 length:345 start_codon:yes stop_codon:yes gene_type:complete